MNRKYTTAALELAIVLLVTQIAFVCGKCAALLERRCTDCGGECLFLLIPVIYYITKQIITDWLTEIRSWKGAESVGKRDPCKGCRYYCGGNSNRWTCDYILIENRRRPCPPGKDCTVKKARKRKGAAKHGETI